MPEAIAGLNGGTVLPDSDASDIATEAQFAEKAGEMVMTIIMTDVIVDEITDNE